MLNNALKRAHNPEVTILETMRLGERVGGSTLWHKKFRGYVVLSSGHWIGPNATHRRSAERYSGKAKQRVAMERSHA